MRFAVLKEIYREYLKSLGLKTDVTRYLAWLERYMEENGKKDVKDLSGRDIEEFHAYVKGVKSRFGRKMSVADTAMGLSTNTGMLGILPASYNRCR